MNKLFFLSLLSLFYNHAYEYPRPFEGYFSQKGQDKFLNDFIFKNKKNGVFIEVGAHDGISFSNTYFFEKNLGWTGICVEPNPNIFKKLTQNRHCHLEQACISNDTGTLPFLLCSGYITEMYSGLLNAYDQRHLDRIEQEIALYGGSQEIILVNCMTFKELFKKYDITHIDLLSIDVEGAEKKLIKTIDFNTVTIDIIVVENNFNEKHLRQFLTSKGYQFIARLGKDDIYQSNIQTKD